jgi:precorrin-2 dehydrogenase/sirohydrochlorin ferrochelatase
MSYYPIFIQLEGENALVVGGGSVACRKVETLLERGASVRIVSRILCPKLERLITKGDIQFLGKEFRKEFLEGVFLVIAATDDEELNHKISQAARAKGLLINAVDQPEDCNFIVPSIVNRGNLQIAISTSGKSPAMAKKIRKDLEGRFGMEYETFLRIMGRIREELLPMGFTQKENSVIFQQVIDSGLLEIVTRGDMKEAEETLSKLLPPGMDMGKILGL